MRTARPSSTVTSMEQVSGQSWGQTARTTSGIAVQFNAPVAAKPLWSAVARATAFRCVFLQRVITDKKAAAVPPQSKAAAPLSEAAHPEPTAPHLRNRDEAIHGASCVNLRARMNRLLFGLLVLSLTPLARAANWPDRPTLRAV